MYALSSTPADSKLAISVINRAVGVDDGPCHRGACAFTEAHAQIEQRFYVEVSQQLAMRMFRRAMTEDAAERTRGSISMASSACDGHREAVDDGNAFRIGGGQQARR